MLGLLSVLITILIVALVVWLAFWVIDMLPLPEQPKLIVKVIVGLIVLIYLLGLLFGAAPWPMHWYRG